jgi:hypothetical protein
MSDIYSVLQTAYATAPLTPTNVRYTPVDPKSYEGSWSGTYSNNQKFEFTISNVNGFRAGQISERRDGAVPASAYRQFLISDRQHQICANWNGTGQGRQRGHRSGHGKYQPGSRQCNPELAARGEATVRTICQSSLGCRLTSPRLLRQSA